MTRLSDRRLVLTLALLIAIVSEDSGSAESADTAWVRSLDAGGGWLDHGLYLRVCPDTTLLVSGNGTGLGTSSDFFTAKFRMNGDTVWTRRFNGPLVTEEEYVADLEIDRWGNVIVTGATRDDQVAECSYATVKYRQDGTEAWRRFYQTGVNTCDEAHGLASDSSGNVYVSGKDRQIPFGGPGGPIVTIKYDSVGSVLWTRQFEGYGDGVGLVHDLEVDIHGHPIVFGEVSKLFEGWNTLILQYNESGDLLWEATYDGPTHGHDQLKDVHVDSSGNIYVAARSRREIDSEGVLLKYANDGSLIWESSFVGVPDGIAIDEAGRVCVVGETDVPHQLPQFLVAMYDSSGQITWSHSLVDSSWEQSAATSVAFDESGAVYVTGYSIADGYDSLVTVKFDAAGDLGWVHTLTNGVGRAVVTTSNDTVYVTGALDDDMSIAKYVDCHCSCVADPFCDGLRSDIVDVVSTIDVVTRGAGVVTEPNCAYGRADVNCDGVSNLLDVTKVIEVAFRGKKPHEMYCTWCWTNSGHP